MVGRIAKTARDVSCMKQMLTDPDGVISQGFRLDGKRYQIVNVCDPLVVRQTEPKFHS